jgi:hypothetical protein
MDEPGIELRQRLLRESEAVHDAPPKILGEDVGLTHHTSAMLFAAVLRTASNAAVTIGIAICALPQDQSCMGLRALVSDCADRMARSAPELARAR